MQVMLGRWARTTVARAMEATLTLESDGITATFAPAAGMVGCSLRHRDQELLGQRFGLDAYIAQRKTMGIPLLHPWANRIARRRFEVAGAEVVIDPQATPLRLDADGLPMHGLLSAARGWRVERHDRAWPAARFDFAADAALMAAFPFAHELLFEAALTGTTLTIATTVHATGATSVPISFGFHPYLRLPGVERAEWEVEIPVAERLVLDDRMLPTGRRIAAHVESGPLGSRTFD